MLRYARRGRGRGPELPESGAGQVRRITSGAGQRGSGILRYGD